MILTRIVRWLGVPTALSLILLLATFGSVTMGLAEVTPELEAAPLSLTAATALLAGWLLARSPLPGWLVGGVALIVGGESVLLRIGRLDRPLLALVDALIRLGLEVWRWPLDEAPDLAPILTRTTDLISGVGRLLSQWWVWMSALLRGEPIYDPLAAALMWNLALWILALWAAWAIGRHQQALPALAPAGALLAAVLSYSKSPPAALLTLLLSTLPLLALSKHVVRQGRWQRDRVDYPQDTGLDLTFAVIGLTIALATAAVLAPPFSIHQVVSYARQLLQGPAEQTDRIAESLGVARGTNQSPSSGNWLATGLPRHHLIGSGPELEEEVVMVIESNPTPADLAQRPYWRSMTFDRYSGNGWLIGVTESVSYQAGELAGDLPAFFHQIIHQEIRVTAEAAGLLYATGTLLAADHDYQVAWRIPSGPDAAAENDLFGATIKATSYQVESWMPTPSKAQLGAAGDDYPAWIEDRYLALPSPLSRRALTLTHQLTATAASPYQRAVAIESYLRTLPYTLDLPAPPSDRDVVDYFLFDLRKGYCDYYATAMVVLARAAGLPARLVIGYASGTYDQANARTIVTQADAHSWAEIYFPGYGWIEFEPTAGRPAIERPDKAPLAEIPKEWQDIQMGKGFPDILSKIGRVWWLGVVLPMLMGIACWWVDILWLRRLSPAEAGATLYRQLTRHGRRLGVAAEEGETCHEFATSLVERIAALAIGMRWSAAAIPAIREVQWLTDLYVRMTYSSHLPDPLVQGQAIQTWRQLRWRLWLARGWQWASGKNSRWAR